MNWNKIELRKITNNLDSKRIPLNSTQRAEKESKPLYPYIGANKIMGYIDEYIFDEKIICIAEDGGSWGYNETCARIYDQKVWVNNHAHVLTAKENLILEYLKYYLNYADLSLHINGATRGKLTKSALSSIKIPLPPLPTQKKIAALLDEADKLRRLNAALLEKYDALTEAVFLEMFGDVITNPKKWKKIPLGNLSKIRRGASPRPIKKFIGGTIPWIKIGDGTKNGSELYISKTKEAITEEGAKKSVILEPGSLIFANCGVSLGFARIITMKGCIHDGWLSLENINETVLNKIFLLKLINSITHYFRNTAPDGTQPNLNTSIMKKFPIPLPPIELQSKFKECYMEIEAQKTKAQASLKKSEELFNALLQRSFSGKE